MDNFKSQVIHVVNTVDKLDLQDRLEALSYLQKITEAYKNKSLPSNIELKSSVNTELVESTRKNVKHKCKNHLCLIYNIKHLKKIACFKCDRRLESELHLFEHSQAHLDHPLSCIHCHCSFRNVEDYNSHKLTDCKQISKDNSCSFQKYVCTICHTSFANKKTFQSHLLISHGTKLYNNWYGCKLCHQMFEQKKMLYHHYKHVHSDSKCPWEIKKKRDSILANCENTSDMKEDEEVERFQCGHCGRSFNRKSILSVHVKRHLRKQEFTCTLCKKTFNKYRNYKRHLSTVSHQSKDGLDNHPLFKCKQCEKVFASHDALSRHNLRTHLSEDRQLKCPLCDFKTTLSSSLSRHVNLHTDNRKFICDQCGSCFHTNSALKEHITYVHSNERNYSCEVCGQRFKLKSGLNRHLKTHSNDKEFKCFCGQLYKFRTNLQRHLMNAHKMGDKKNGILRVTTEEQGYAVNSPKHVQRKPVKPVSEKVDIEESKIDDDFDISSLTALSDVDLSCADEVLCETYDDLSKYAVENGESQESFNSILAPVNNLIDHVLQETAEARMKQTTDKYQQLMSNDTLAGVSNQLLNMNYRGSTCRQYMTSSSFGDLSPDQYSQLAAKIDNQYLNQAFDNTNVICDAFNRQYLPDIQVEDESSFSYSKWLNEIL